MKLYEKHSYEIFIDYVENSIKNSKKNFSKKDRNLIWKPIQNNITEANNPKLLYEQIFTFILVFHILYFDWNELWIFSQSVENSNEHIMHTWFAHFVFCFLLSFISFVSCGCLLSLFRVEKTLLWYISVKTILP